jgi:hypothetical protein
MKKYRRSILCLVVIISLFFTLSACGAKAEIGEEFTLSVGQTITITNEDLEITFLQVLGDNRCPRDVVCITAGEVVCLIQISQNEFSNNVELGQPGLYYDYSEESFGGYKYIFRVDPYPELDKILSSDEYRIFLTIRK